MSYIYLGSPYTHPNKDVEKARYNYVCKWVADRIRLYTKPTIYSPIMHWHPVAIKHSLPTDYIFWSTTNRLMLDKAVGLWVLQLPGWQSSKGLTEEINYADENSIKIKFIEIK